MFNPLSELKNKLKNSPFVPSRKRQIAIVGMAGAGKTVMLTSLINHLLYPDCSRFSLTSKVASIVEIQRPKVVRGDSRNQFNYGRMREELSKKREWPEKTVDTSHITVSFERSDGLRETQVHFFDFPGERVADAAVFAFPRYEDWADHILEHFNDSEEYRNHTSAFLTKIDDPKVSAHELCHAYKRLLITLHRNYLPLISPSTFLLDTKGKKVGDGNPSDASDDALIEDRYSGLAPEKNETSQEFVPLTPNKREEAKDMTRIFSKNYSAYRNRVVAPLFDSLLSSDAVAILVSIPDILMGGVGRFNDTRDVLQSFLEIYQEKGLSSWLWEKLRLKGSKTSNILFVASQADLVHPDDRDKLKGLLTEMTRRGEDVIDRKITTHRLTMSAVISTRKGDTDHTLRGIPYSASENPGKDEYEFHVSELPESWPESWKPKEYIFHKVWPKVPENTQIPPSQRGLDEVFNFLLGD